MASLLGRPMMLRWNRNFKNVCRIYAAVLAPFAWVWLFPNYRILVVCPAPRKVNIIVMGLLCPHLRNTWIPFIKLIAYIQFCASASIEM
jgi:hypothetical protein